MFDKICYFIDEAARMLGLSRSRVKEEIYSGNLQSIKVGRRRLVPYWAFEPFMRDNVASVSNQSARNHSTN